MGVIESMIILMSVMEEIAHKIIKIGSGGKTAVSQNMIKTMATFNTALRDFSHPLFLTLMAFYVPTSLNVNLTKILYYIKTYSRYSLTRRYEYYYQLYFSRKII